MSRQNDSFASNSRAASVAFRQNDLKRAGILFPPEAYAPPSDIEQLKIRITNRPHLLRSAETDDEIKHAIQQIEVPFRALYKKAFQAAKLIDSSLIVSCSLQHERVWMREVNEPMLSIFFNARRQGTVSTTEDFVWKEGKDLVSIMSPFALSDPKPDVAVGLKYAKNSSDISPERLSLTIEELENLRESARFGLVYSPSHRHDIIYPAIIYEAKSDSNPILWAENQVAVGAARALGLLAELSRLANSTDVPPVFAVTSSGTLWQIHIAFLSQDGTVSVSPLLTKKLSIEDFPERFFLQLVLHRIQEWLLGPYRDFIEQRLQTIVGENAS